MTFQFLKGAYRKAGEGIFVRAYGNRTRGNGFKLEEGRFRLDVRKFLTVRVLRHWNSEVDHGQPHVQNHISVLDRPHQPG